MDADADNPGGARDGDGRQKMSPRARLIVWLAVAVGVGVPIAVWLLFFTPLSPFPIYVKPLHGESFCYTGVPSTGIRHFQSKVLAAVVDDLQETGAYDPLLLHSMEVSARFSWDGRSATVTIRGSDDNNGLADTRESTERMRFHFEREADGPWRYQRIRPDPP